MTAATETSQTDMLARAFAEIIRDACADLDAENPNEPPLIDEINAKNAKPENAPYCATHDYFDANMAMLAAFQSVLNRDPTMVTEDATDDEDSADSDLWNAAWATAKQAGFWSTDQAAA